MHKLAKLCLLVVMFGTSAQTSDYREEPFGKDTRKQKLVDQQADKTKIAAKNRKHINDRRPQHSGSGQSKK